MNSKKENGSAKAIESSSSGTVCKVKESRVGAAAVSKDASSTSVKSSAALSSGSMNFFQVCKPFPCLADHDGQVPTDQYIEAVQNLAEFISKLGLAFWSVRTDITNSCSLVRAYYEKNKQDNKYIDKLIANNKAESAKKKGWFWESEPVKNDTYSSDSNSVTVSETIDALLWMHRSMSFFGHILRSLIEEHDARQQTGNQSSPPAEDMGAFFRNAYEKTLAPHSSWLMGALFEVVLKATPTRSEFLALAMGNGANKLTEDEVFEKMRVYLRLLEATNEALLKSITKHGYAA